MKASLWDRLRDRKMVQWALAYLAGAWVVVEATSLVVDQFGWPAVMGQSVTVIAVFGFFLTLVLAWYHGEKGHQRVGGTEILVIAAILGAAGLVLTRLPGSSVGSDGTADLLFDVEPLGPNSVAVLPFDALNAQMGERDPLAAGIHSELYTQLTKVGALEVIGRGSVARYASTEKTLPTIGRELGVANLAGGTIARDADRVRLNVHLTQAASGEQLWAEAYERDLTAASLFEIQAEIATEIARALGVVLSGTEQVQLAERPTENLEAYEAYLLGRSHFDADRALDAVAEFERATRLDPNFAAAWAGLGATAAQSYYLSSGRRNDHLDMARGALDQAQRLAPASAETLVAQSIFHTYVDLDYDRALTKLTEALEQRPGDVYVVTWMANPLRHAGRWEEAVSWAERAVAMDPANAEAAHTLGYILRYMRRYDEAFRYLERAAVLTPDDPVVFSDRVNTALWGFGDTAMAAAVIEETAHMPPLTEGFRRWRRELAWVHRDMDALATLLVDSMWTDLQATARYNWLRRLQTLKGDTALHGIYVDSLIAARERGLELALAAPQVPFQRFLESSARSRLGTALALRGDVERAIHEINRALQLDPRALTDVNGAIIHRYVALTYTFLGHTDTAIDWIERELAQPGVRLTVEMLRLDPDFDSLREHPRFQALLERGSVPH